ncbi:MAG: 5-formyltetrahydrofolate cyclo-ligase, partial [Elusimicrobia bacterium]|nr:5-formyltetrahydrofolate cyclo-ligase [Elusimicrobiota bacterium]MBD3411535.1 5-formyltetrahydrofolate cyclo-ligase [Elusimicrobiota bacterium]
MSVPKKQVREYYRGCRDRLSDDDRRNLSGLIHQRLYAEHEWISSSSIMVYASCRSEVETMPVLRKACEHKKATVVPAVREDDSIVPVRITSITELSDTCRYGILQPHPDLMSVYESILDLIIVPGIVFDPCGGRIGYGKGFFDRFLSSHPAAYRIGLAFECQVSRDPIPQA